VLSSEPSRPVFNLVLTLFLFSLIVNEEADKNNMPTRIQGNKLVESLRNYFDKGGGGYEMTFDEVMEIAQKVHQRFMTQRALHDGRRTKFGTPSEQWPSSDSSGMPNFAAIVALPTLDRSLSSERQGDNVITNNVLFMRDVGWYLELCSAISEGDTGRVLEILNVRLRTILLA
jgi:hypothetical protein